MIANKDLLIQCHLHFNMIITVTRKYIRGSNIGHINKNNYNMDSWEDALEWAEMLAKDKEIYPFEIIEMKNEYGQTKIYEVKD